MCHAPINFQCASIKCTTINWVSINWVSTNWGSINWVSINWVSINWVSTFAGNQRMPLVPEESSSIRGSRHLGGLSRNSTEGGHTGQARPVGALNQGDGGVVIGKTSTFCGKVEF
jgi:hypothetical protein